MLCWARSTTVEYPLLANGQTDSELDSLETAVRRVAEDFRSDAPADPPPFPAERIRIRSIRHPDAAKAALERALQQQVELGQPQPIAYPLPRSVSEAVYEHVAMIPDVQIMLMGRSGRLDPVVDVGVYLASEKPVSRSLADEITAIVRREMKEPDLEVHVITVQNAWKGEPGEKWTPAPEPEE